MNNTFLNGVEIKNVVVVSTIVCSYCGKNDHTNSVCFKKHGLPTNKNSTGRKTCSHCGKTSHTIDLCYKKHEFPLGHKFHNGSNQDTKNDDSREAVNQEVRLTQQQYQALMAHIKNPNDIGATSTSQISSMVSNSTNSGITTFNLNSHEDQGIISWILDSGATGCVAFSLTHLCSYEKITPTIRAVFHRDFRPTSPTPQGLTSKNTDTTRNSTLYSTRAEVIGRDIHLPAQREAIQTARLAARYPLFCNLQPTLNNPQSVPDSTSLPRVITAGTTTITTECKTILDQPENTSIVRIMIKQTSSKNDHHGLLDDLVDPQNYKEALQHDYWQQAMQEEIIALEHNTRIITTLSPNKKAIGCKWVYKTNISQKWHMQQLDVNNAFLQGDLNEEVYMQPPPGITAQINDDNRKSRNPKTIGLRRKIFGLQHEAREKVCTSPKGENVSGSEIRGYRSVKHKVREMALKLVRNYVEGKVMGKTRKGSVMVLNFSFIKWVDQVGSTRTGFYVCVVPVKLLEKWWEEALCNRVVGVYIFSVKPKRVVESIYFPREVLREWSEVVYLPMKPSRECGVKCINPVKLFKRVVGGDTLTDMVRGHVKMYVGI
ncbi:hypothetical protein V8G54_005470 [Vigna mungo]|uniref:Reverse transcriptase Ty1/copia-type domain-containing protein n=1 Tax=Vigna mungo TaxID=3915 RepID=A0AAQ3NYP8_VIGMU